MGKNFFSGRFLGLMFLVFVKHFSYLEYFLGQYVPRAECSMGRMFLGQNVPWTECSMGRMFLGQNVSWVECFLGRMIFG